ncbi:MAG: transglutaminase family protein [Steroidobacter sp.]
MQRLRILHRTQYNFTGIVNLGPHRLLLRPREGHELRIEYSQLNIKPTAVVHWMRDEYNNSVALATFTESTQMLEIASEVIVQQYDEMPLDFVVANNAVHYPFTYDMDAVAVLQPYLTLQTQTHQFMLRQWLQQYWSAGENIQTYTLLMRLCEAIHRNFKDQAREQPGVQTAGETLARGMGSCRDFANLLMEAVRMLGLAARFVSGYLNTPVQETAGSTHAWTEIYIPGVGWKGFDPTLGEIVGGKHIAVAASRLPDAVSPVTGSFFGPVGADLFVGVEVTTL